MEFIFFTNETTEAKTKPWMAYKNIAQKKGVTSSSLFEKADAYFNKK